MFAALLLLAAFLNLIHFREALAPSRRYRCSPPRSLQPPHCGASDIPVESWDEVPRTTPVLLIPRTAAVLLLDGVALSSSVCTASVRCPSSSSSSQTAAPYSLTWLSPDLHSQ
jgi:hypothetical protein